MLVIEAEIVYETLEIHSTFLHLIVCHLLNVQGPGGIRQTEIHTAEPFVPEPSTGEVEVAIRKLKRYEAPGSNRIPAELIQAGGEHCILRYINLC
jgi:hypothetical protein